MSIEEIEEKVKKLAAKVKDLKSHIETEEATKNAFISPFIRDILGYDIFDPREVIPEYVADVGKKRGEKVDYAIKSGNDFRFLIECKAVGSPLSLDHADQLVRYFTVTDAEFAILTNGEVYQFYTQLDKVNRMDERPFMVLDLAEIDARLFPSLEKCTKSNFDAETITAVAEEMKYVSEVKKVISSQFKTPSDEWVKLLAGQVSARKMTAKNLEFFHKVVSTATAQYLNDEASRRLRNAQAISETESPVASPDPTPPSEIESEPPEIETTEDEVQGFMIVRAISCALVNPKRVAIRDAKSYCAILFDDNNRKPIVRLYFNSSKYRVGLFGADKSETIEEIENVTDIYRFQDLIKERVKALTEGS